MQLREEVAYLFIARCKLHVVECNFAFIYFSVIFFLVEYCALVFCSFLFGLSFVAAIIIVFLISISPAFWFLSINYVVPFVPKWFAALLLHHMFVYG